MVVFSPFVLLLCTLWEPCARFFNRYYAFIDQKKKKARINLNILSFLFYIFLYSY